MLFGSDSVFRDKFLQSAAETFFVTAYADWVESDEDNRKYNRPGPGGDWVDYAPETPLNAYALAGQLWAELERDNLCSVYALVDKAIAADGIARLSSAGGYAAEFGHCLAMQAMGHGVSWFDSHAKFELCVPHIECSMYSFDSTVYAGF